VYKNVDVISTQTVYDPLKPNMPHPSATSTPGPTARYLVADAFDLIKVIAINAFVMVISIAFSRSGSSN